MIIQNWINILLGAIVVGVAFYGLTGTTLTWTLGILGAGIILIELWEANSIAVLSERSTTSM